MQNNDDYWFFIEPQVFIFTSKTKVILYNYLSKKTLSFNLEGIESVINALLDKDNLYVIPITDKCLKDDKIGNFVTQTRKLFFGDIIKQSYSKCKPVIIPPLCKIQKEIEASKNFDYLPIGENIMSCLKEITLFVTERCDAGCKWCDAYYKQFIFCSSSKSNNFIPIEQIQRILNEARTSFLSRINICGGNVFSYPNWPQLAELLESFFVEKVVYVHYLNVDFKKISLFLKQDNSFINILITAPFSKEKLDNVIQTFSPVKENIRWTFVVSSESEFQEFDELTDQWSLENVSFRPFFNGNNFDFFKQNIFMSLDDIEVCSADKNELFAKQVVNVNDYGKLVISANEQVYANMNHLPIGATDESLSSLILKEYVEGNSWKNTRLSMQPCNECIYKVMCPSPSNYEYVMKQFDLCNLTNSERGF